MLKLYLGIVGSNGCSTTILLICMYIHEVVYWNQHYEAVMKFILGQNMMLTQSIKQSGDLRGYL